MRVVVPADQLDHSYNCQLFSAFLNPNFLLKTAEHLMHFVGLFAYWGHIANLSQYFIADLDFIKWKQLLLFEAVLCDWQYHNCIWCICLKQVMFQNEHQAIIISIVLQYHSSVIKCFMQHKWFLCFCTLAFYIELWPLTSLFHPHWDFFLNYK